MISNISKIKIKIRIIFKAVSKSKISSIQLILYNSGDRNETKKIILFSRNDGILPYKCND